MSEREPNYEEDTMDTERVTEHEREKSPLRWLSGIVSLFGLWIAAAPFVYGGSEIALWNNVAVGVAVFLVAGYNYYRMATRLPASVAAAGLVALLGLWSIAAPFVLVFLDDGLFWSTVVSGIVVAALAGYNVYETRQARAADRVRTRA